MRVVPVIVRLAQLSLLGVLGACANKHPALPVPPPDQPSPISEELRARVHLNEVGLGRDGFEKTRHAIERTLDGIVREYGENSVAIPQSITETALMVSGETNYSNALPYFARALDASVAVYGAEHRETGFAVHDYAYAQVLASPGKYVPAATPLFERALAIRRKVLGPDAPETAGSERSLADQLVGKCRSQVLCPPDDPSLEQAAQLAEHALGVIRASLGDDHRETAELERAVDEIAQARGKPVVARAPKPEAPAVSASTCGHTSKAETVDDLSWVRTDEKLYRLATDGSFSVGGFDGRPWKQISRHNDGNASMSSLWSSNDHRWIAYHGDTAGREEELWLFDARAQKERRVALTPKYHTSSPEFSPNGSTLAYFASYDDRWTRKQGMGLYLVDTASGRNIFAGYPADTALGPLLGFGSIQWAADGSAVLLHLVGHPNDEFTREFHRFDMTTRTFRRIGGTFDKSVRNGEEFVERGRVIATHVSWTRSTSAWYGELNSPSGAWRAWVDEKHRLLVRHANEPERIVELGGYNNCEGVTIGITGWVGDQYLVYRNRSRQIIYDPAGRRHAVLINLDEQRDTFTR